MIRKYLAILTNAFRKQTRPLPADWSVTLAVLHRMKPKSLLLVAADFALLATVTACSIDRLPAQDPSLTKNAVQRPNVLIILADDLGYSDIGPYGSEIRTPNLDRLAQQGVRMTHFHSAPSCSPSRAMLLSGTDIHTAGLGAAPEYIPAPMQGRQGFEGYLTERVATIAERLDAAGYETMMAGKWHMGQADGQRPAQRGFDHSFALLQGAADHFGDGGFAGPENANGRADYVLDDRPYTPGNDFYSSDAWTDWMIAHLSASRSRPFFAYLAFTAPHSPLQAPAEDIARQKGKYDDGWAMLAERRMAAMRASGVLPGKLAPGTEHEGPDQASWDALSPQDKAAAAREMEIYAAMVSHMDQQIGRVLTLLDQRGELDNTLVIFMSDNGPAGEQAQTYALMPGFKEKYESARKGLDAMGHRGSFVLRNPQWAKASAAPSRLFKSFVTEGGTLIPAIMRFPGLPANGRSNLVGDLRDILPTIMDATGVPEDSVIKGHQVAIMEGRSLLPWLRAGRDDRPIEEVAFAQYGQASVRYGPWKLMRMPPPAGTGEWQLFNTDDDPGERHDLSSAQHEILERLLAVWAGYEREHGLSAEQHSGH